MGAGYVVASGAVVAERRTIGAAQGCERLEQAVLTLAEAGSAERATGDAEEVLYVLGGHGTVAGEPVAPETAVFLAPGETYRVENTGAGALELVSVRLPGPPPADGADGPRRSVLRLEEQATGEATADREFRLLADPATGCRGATQFVGYIPPGRAPDHFHTYDEVLYVLDGEGVMHLPWGDTDVRRGSCVHLPARVVHSLENAGAGTLQVLGVFRPAGSPSEAYYPDGTPALTPEEDRLP